VTTGPWHNCDRLCWIRGDKNGFLFKFLLQLIKYFLCFLCLGELCIFLYQLINWQGNFGIVLNEFSVKITESKEFSHLLDYRGC